MTLGEEVIVAMCPVVLTWCGAFLWLMISDHMKHKLHDERWAELKQEIGALKSMCELNNKIIIRRGWANLLDDEPEKR